MSHLKHPTKCPYDNGNCHYPCVKLQLAHQRLAMTRDELAAALGVSPRTWERYRTGLKRPIRAICSAVAAMDGHVQAPGWDGWFFKAKEQKLYFLELKDGFGPKDILSLHFLRQQLHAQERRIRELEAEQVPADGASDTGHRHQA